MEKIWHQGPWLPKLDLDSFSDDMVSVRDTYESASTLMSFPLLALFTHRSVHGTNACFRPDVNHHQVFMQNLYKPQGVDGRPGMADTIFNPSSTRTLNATPMGVWFYFVDVVYMYFGNTYRPFLCQVVHFRFPYWSSCYPQKHPTLPYSTCYAIVM